jgi:hypothetical protein
MSSEGFHEFVFDFQHDDAGNFYFAKANPVNGGGRGFGDQKASRGNGTVSPHAGCVFKLSPDGKKLDIIARALRAPTASACAATARSRPATTRAPGSPRRRSTGSKQGNFLGVG